MHRHRISITSLPGVAALVGLFGLVALAAPILRGGPKLSDEIRSMAGLDHLNLVIMTLPKLLKESGFDQIHIHDQWREHLTEVGIKLAPSKREQGKTYTVPSDETPTLRLAVATFTDAAVPDAVGYLNILTLEQNVHMEGQEGRLRVPTWTGLHMGMKTKEHLARGFKATLDQSLKQFLARIQMVKRQGQ